MPTALPLSLGFFVVQNSTAAFGFRLGYSDLELLISVSRRTQQRFPQMGEKHHVVTLRVVHRAAHAGETFAEAEIVGRIVLGRFAVRPVPVAAVLNIHNVN